MKNKTKFQRKFKAMSAKAIELGYENIREAEKNGEISELKKAFNNKQ